MYPIVRMIWSPRNLRRVEDLARGEDDVRRGAALLLGRGLWGRGPRALAGVHLSVEQFPVVVN